MGGKEIKTGNDLTDNKIIIYQTDDKKIEVKLKAETLWLNLNQIAFLFDVQKAAISKHIKNIFKSGELNPDSTVSILETVQIEGKRKVKRKINEFKSTNYINRIINAIVGAIHELPLQNRLPETRRVSKYKKIHQNYELNRCDMLLRKMMNEKARVN